MGRCCWRWRRSCPKAGKEITCNQPVTYRTEGSWQTEYFRQSWCSTSPLHAISVDTYRARGSERARAALHIDLTVGNFIASDDRQGTAAAREGAQGANSADQAQVRTCAPTLCSKAARQSVTSIYCWGCASPRWLSSRGISFWQRRAPRGPCGLGPQARCRARPCARTDASD